MISKDVLSTATSTAISALLCLAWAYEDAERVDVKNTILQLRKQLIAATSGRCVR